MKKQICDVDAKNLLTECYTKIENPFDCPIIAFVPGEGKVKLYELTKWNEQRDALLILQGFDSFKENTSFLLDLVDEPKDPTHPIVLDVYDCHDFRVRLERLRMEVMAVIKYLETGITNDKENKSWSGIKVSFRGTTLRT